MFQNHMRPVHTKTRCNFVTLPALAEVSQRCKAVPPVSPVLAGAQFHVEQFHVAQASFFEYHSSSCQRASEAFDLCMQLVNGVVETTTKLTKQITACSGIVSNLAVHLLHRDSAFSGLPDLG